jgi:hypothetical protein
MQEVLVWGGEHPDEPKPIEFVRSLQENPIEHVDADIANPRALKLGRRFVHTNMAIASPGNLFSPKYERRRIVPVLRKSRKYGAVMNMHTFGGHGKNMAFIDLERGVSRTVLGFLGELGIKELVSTDYGGMQKYVANTFALETDPHGLGGDFERLRGALDMLANDPNPPTKRAAEFAWYHHVGVPHVSQVHPDELTDDMRSALLDFQPLPDDITARLDLPGRQVHLSSWRYIPNEYGYWGELVEPIAVPDDSAWPAAA